MAIGENRIGGGRISWLIPCQILKVRIDKEISDSSLQDSVVDYKV